MRRFVEIVCVAFFLMALNSEDISKIRKTYYQALTQEKSISTLHELGKQHQNTAVGKAYYGTAKALQARESSWVPTKISLANEASELLNSAVELDNNSTEVRFLRLSFEAATPAMLNLNSHVNSDVNFLSNKLEKNHPLNYVIKAWVNKTDDITKNQKARIKARLLP